MAPPWSCFGKRLDLLKVEPFFLNNHVWEKTVLLTKVVPFAKMAPQWSLFPKKRLKTVPLFRKWSCVGSTVEVVLKWYLNGGHPVDRKTAQTLEPFRLHFFFSVLPEGIPILFMSIHYMVSIQSIQSRSGSITYSVYHAEEIWKENIKGWIIKGFNVHTKRSSLREILLTTGDGAKFSPPFHRSPWKSRCTNG